MSCSAKIPIYGVFTAAFFPRYAALVMIGLYLLGILVGTLSVEVGAWSLGTSISYPLLAASSAGSILFSAIIGVAGGLYPAIQASRMDVVSALRFE